MEPFSILELTSTVLKLSLKLYKFFKAVHDAPGEIEEYLSVLDSIRHVFIDVQDYAELHQRSAFGLRDGLQLKVIEPALKDCELEFALQLSFIESMDPGATASIFRRSKGRTEWVLRKETVENLTRKLERLQGLLAMTVATSTGKNDVFLRQKLETVGHEVHQVHQRYATEAADREQFLSKLQQYLGDLQRGTGLYLQLAKEANLQSDFRLHDMAESLAVDLSSVTANEAEPETTESQNPPREQGLPTTTEGSFLLSSDAGTASEQQARGSTQEANPPEGHIDPLSNSPRQVILQAAMEDAFSRFSLKNPGVSPVFQEIPSFDDIAQLTAKSQEKWSKRRTSRFTRLVSSTLSGRFKDLDSLVPSNSQQVLSLYWSAMHVLLNADQDDMAMLTDGMEELSDAIVVCEREISLYKAQRLYNLVSRVYYEFLEAMSLCTKYYQRSPIQAAMNRLQFRPAFEARIAEIRRLSQAILREVDYHHRLEMRDTGSRVVAMQVEQRKILSTLQDQRRILQSLREERKIMDLVHEQQKILQVVQQIQSAMREADPKGEK